MTTSICRNRTLPVDILLFEVDDQRYALPAAAVVEVVAAVRVTPLPAGPEVIEGVINYRGRLAAVLDVRTCFGGPGIAPAPRHHFILATVGRRLLALHVDRATGIARLKREIWEQAVEVAPKTHLIAGVAKLPDGLVVVHDLEEFLSAAEEAQLDAALVAAAGEARQPSNP